MTDKAEKTPAGDDRRSRSGAALRANLRRRKEQARGRADEAQPEPPADSVDQSRADQN